MGQDAPEPVPVPAPSSLDVSLFYHLPPPSTVLATTLLLPFDTLVAVHNFL